MLIKNYYFLRSQFVSKNVFVAFYYKWLLFFGFVIYMGVLAKAQQQPQFKFWLAFEDSVGQKDTLWVIIDSTANSTVTINDSLLGEIPIGEIDSGKFHVYYLATYLDSYNVYAVATFKKNVSVNIQAQNYRLPIIVRWDSSLFKNNNLPWEIKTAWLNHHNFWPANQILLWMDSLIIYPQPYPFPIWFYISELDLTKGINEPENQTTGIIYPNPFKTHIYVNLPQNQIIDEITITNNFGQVQYHEQNVINKEINLGFLPAGIYYAHILFNNKPNQIEKIIKL